MAIDLEGIMNRIMNMVEKKQNNMPSEMQMYNDAQTQHKWDAIDKVNIAKDQFASNERTAQLAHPEASLDFRGREAYANAAIGKMNAETQHNLGMAAYGYGSGKQAEATGNYQQAQADKQNMLMPVFQRMSNQDQAQALFDRLPERQNTAPVKEAEYNYLQSPQSSTSIASPELSITNSSLMSNPQIVDKRETFAAKQNSNYNNLTEQLMGPVVKKKPITWLDQYNAPRSTLGF